MIPPDRPGRFRAMLHPAITTSWPTWLAEEPIAAQSMFYWKPPKARGQALHQDNFYLRVHPGTCIAAWAPLDDCDAENGCLIITPGSHGFVCPEEAEPTISFTKHFVPVPQGLAKVPGMIKAGDVLFFGGNLIHGSYPNQSVTRFIRTFIAHYVGVSAEEIARFYKPLYRRDGSEILTQDTPKDGGPCGECRKRKDRIQGQQALVWGGPLRSRHAVKDARGDLHRVCQVPDRPPPNSRASGPSSRIASSSV